MDDEEIDEEKMNNDWIYETIDSDVSDNLFQDWESDSDFASPGLLDASSRTPCWSGQDGEEI